jgi:membrane dipeptidase
LCDHPRNVPDDVLRLTATNGGVVMVCFLPTYLKETDRARSALGEAEKARLEKLYPNDAEAVEAALKTWWRSQARPTATLRDVADHIDHIRQVAGIDHVGIGADYEGFTGPPEGLEDVSKYPELLLELRRRGYTPAEIKQVAGLNLLRVMRGAERVAAQTAKVSKIPLAPGGGASYIARPF